MGSSSSKKSSASQKDDNNETLRYDVKVEGATADLSYDLTKPGKAIILLDTDDMDLTMKRESLKSSENVKQLFTEHLKMQVDRWEDNYTERYRKLVNDTDFQDFSMLIIVIITPVESTKKDVISDIPGWLNNPSFESLNGKPKLIFFQVVGVKEGDRTHDLKTNLQLKDTLIVKCNQFKGARKTFLWGLVEVLKKENGHSGVKNIIKKLTEDLKNFCDITTCYDILRKDIYLIPPKMKSTLWKTFGRGILIIDDALLERAISNDTKNDRKLVNHLFDNLGLQSEEWINLTEEELQQKSVSFQDKDTVRQYRDASVIIVVVISCERTCDRKRVDWLQLPSWFKHLSEVPKLFFIQQYGQALDIPSLNPATLDNCYLLCAHPEGRYVHLNPTFISALVNTIEEFKGKKHVTQILGELKKKLLGWEVNPVGDLKQEVYLPGIAPKLVTTAARNSIEPALYRDEVPLKIRGKHKITQYARQEWHGATENAKTMMLGYIKLTRNQFTELQVVRGDNYCAIRSVIYQVLRQNIKLDLTELGELKTSALEVFKHDKYDLSAWSFANRSEFMDFETTVSEKVYKCLESFYELYHKCNAKNVTEIELQNYFNSTERNDVTIMEAIKVLMMLSVIDLYDKYVLDPSSVPHFAILLFIRDTSPDPAAFFRNHINNVGDSGGLEQVEMFLLAHTLGISIRVFRISQHDEEDFCTYYNDTDDEKRLLQQGKQITIVSEDDRHYNMIL